MASNLAHTQSAPNLADVEKARSTGTLYRRDPQLVWRYRTQTHDRQHAETVGARKPPKLPPYGLNIGAGKPFPKQLPAADTYVVEFNDADDPLHPQNWTSRRKLIACLIVGYATLVSSFGSSMWSSGSAQVAAEFGVSTEVTTLGLALYVLGFALGPIIWAPLSELRGRKLPLVLGAFGLGVFLIGSAVAKDLQTVLICRFFAGCFGAAPLTCGAAVVADCFDNSDRGVAIAIYSLAGFGGPFVAPTMGGFIAHSYLRWRWTQYLPAILAFSVLAIHIFFLEETYPAAILVSKAEKLRKVSKNWGIHAKQEEIEVDLKQLVQQNLSRPLRLLFTEPIVLLLSIYTAFIYGLLYVFLTAYPIVFQRIRGMNAGVGSLPLLALIVGELFACAYLIWQQPRYVAKLKANNDVNIPEWRLPPMVIGGTLYALGLLWFGWAGYHADVHWIVPTISGLFTGFGNYMIILQAQNYLLDAYLHFSASAIAANSIARSLAGAGFPMFATYMYQRLRVQWAQTLLGCLAAIMVPIPILFNIHGPRIRKRSKLA